MSCFLDKSNTIFFFCKNHKLLPLNGSVVRFYKDEMSLVMDFQRLPKLKKLFFNINETRKIVLKNVKESKVEHLSIVYHGTNNGNIRKQKQLCAAKLKKYKTFPVLEILEYRCFTDFIPLFNKVSFCFSLKASDTKKIFPPSLNWTFSISIWIWVCTNLLRNSLIFFFLFPSVLT